MTKVTVVFALICVASLVLIDAAPPRSSGQGNTGNGRGRSGNRGNNRNNGRRTTTTTTPPTTPPSQGWVGGVAGSAAGGAGMAVAGETVKIGVDVIKGKKTESSEVHEVPVQTIQPKVTIKHADKKENKTLTIVTNGMLVFVFAIAVIVIGVLGYCLHNHQKSNQVVANAIDMRSRFRRSY